MGTAKDHIERRKQRRNIDDMAPLVGSSPTHRPDFNACGGLGGRAESMPDIESARKDPLRTHPTSTLADTPKMACPRLVKTGAGHEASFKTRAGLAMARQNQAEQPSFYTQNPYRDLSYQSSASLLKPWTSEARRATMETEQPEAPRRRHIWPNPEPPCSTSRSPRPS